MSTRIEVCPVSELPPGERTIVEVDGIPHSVGVFNVDGEYYALANVCPHHLAPLCEGTITGEMVSEGVGDYELVREGEIVQCPWHGWKFDVTDGRSVFNPHALRTRTYEATVEPGADDEAQSDREEEGPDTAESTESDVTGSGGFNGTNSSEADYEEYGTALKGDEPPVETYNVDVEQEYVVLYV